RRRRATSPSSSAQHHFQKLSYNQLPFMFRTQHLITNANGIAFVATLTIGDRNGLTPLIPFSTMLPVPPQHAPIIRS
ncbi:hypothetical protein, partial [Streptomyces sp. AK02-04a]|uniref:hypothetical protein n=1 Tax=Streptomyces sp. AK02-04a TaxID=3028649 RepID=UPI0029AB4342